MSARTAARRPAKGQSNERRRIESARAKPTVTVGNVKFKGAPIEDDWYTPDVLKLSPLVVSATMGKKGDGRALCEIEEDGWERQSFTLRLMFDQRRVPGVGYAVGCMHSDISNNEYGDGVAGTFTAKDVDNLIGALTAVRDRAREMDLLKARPKPKSIRDVFPEWDKAPSARAS